MKLKKLMLLTTVLISVSTFATAVSQIDLAKVNAYIASLIDLETEDFVVKVENANRLENGKISSMEVSVADDLLALSGTIDLDEKHLLMGLSLNGNSKELLGDSESLRMMIVEMIHEYVEMFNEQDFYKITFSYSEVDNHISSSITVVPLSPDAISINSFNLKLDVDLISGMTIGSVNTDLNTQSDLVLKGQLALTNIFEALINEQEPEEGLELLSEVIGEILDSMEFDL